MELETLAHAWRGRTARRRERRLRRAEAARQAAREAAAVLRREFEVEEVWLFGSLLGEPRHDGFDIDLAVRGLRPERYYAALARVSEPIARPVHLVTLETCKERLRHIVAGTARRIDRG